MDYSPYIAIFKDTLTSNILFLLREEVALDAVFSFGGYNLYLVGLFYVLGAIIGITLTYLPCRILPVVFKKYQEAESYVSFREVINKFDYIFFALLALPFPGFAMAVPVFAGIAKMNPIRFIVFTAIYKTIYIIALILLKT